VAATSLPIDMNASLAEALAAAGWHFHYMMGAGHRLMCSWATAATDIDALVRDLRRRVS
jgi:threonine aldolase